MAFQCFLEGYSYHIDEIATRLVTSRPLKFGFDHNATTVTHPSTTTKQQTTSKPFRPSKQLYDGVFFLPSTKNVENNAMYKRMDSVIDTNNTFYTPMQSYDMGNILVLPPEALTYKFNEEGNLKIDEDKGSNERMEDQRLSESVIYGKPFEFFDEPQYEDEDHISENLEPIKKKQKEVHYHQHKHMHDHEHKQDHKHKHRQEHMHNHSHGHKHDSQQDHHHQDHHEHQHKGNHHHIHEGDHQHEHRGSHYHDHKGEHQHDHEHNDEHLHKEKHDHGHEHLEGHNHQHHGNHRHGHKHGHLHRGKHHHHHNSEGKHSHHHEHDGHHHHKSSRKSRQRRQRRHREKVPVKKHQHPDDVIEL